MGDHNREAHNQESLTNDEILTERKVRRRAFLSTTGVLLAGGAAAVVAGARAMAQDVAPQGDPNRQQTADPQRQGDQTRSDPDQKRGDAKPTDKRRTDPDKTGDRKRGDPDKARRTDPDKARPQDPAPPPQDPNPPLR